MEVYDDTPCDLGEGALWHPERRELIWFDITARRMHRLTDHGRVTVAFDAMVSAAGWVDAETLLVASERALLRFDLRDGARREICPLEPTNPITRSNDGRADPWGGFWIGTMGRAAEPGAGAIYRYFRGELRRLHAGLTIPNAICFAPDRSAVYFTDTPTRQIMTQPLDLQTGWPDGEPRALADLGPHDRNPDGATVDADGAIWCACWGSSAVVRIAPDGAIGDARPLPAPHATCPAFGGPDLTTLFCTSARQGLDATGLAQAPLSGQTFALAGAGRGRAEPQVIL